MKPSVKPTLGRPRKPVASRLGSQKLNKALAKSGMTIRDFSKHIGVNTATLGAALCGDRVPSLPNMLTIETGCAAYGVRIKPQDWFTDVQAEAA